MLWEEKITLVISGWGSKAMYALGILKAIEELDLKKQIVAVYWVSAWALSAAYWLSWWKAEDIYKKNRDSELFTIKNISLLPMKGLMKSWTMETIVKWDMKKYFSQLECPLYVGATDLLKGKFILYNSWVLLPTVLWSLAVPWIFAPVPYENALLVDGWVTNNFPIEIAKKAYPNTKIVGILLSKFKKNQKVSNLVDILQVTYDLLLRWHISKSLNEADILFYRDLKTWMVENNEKKLRHLFDMGYEDWIAAFTS